MSTVRLHIRDKKKAVLIANFANGQVNRKRSHELTVEHFTSNKDGPARKKRKQMLVAETDRMTYVGQDFGPSADRTQSYCKYYVGVRDKDSGRMSVYDAEIFHMLPKMKGDEEEEMKDLTSLSYAEKKDSLTEAFGSKKKQKAMELRLRNVSAGKSLETILGSAVQQAVAAGEVEHKSGASPGHTDLIPPCNKDADQPEDVYYLGDIISDREMEAIAVSAQTFFDSTPTQVMEWKRQKEYPLFILSHLSALPMVEEDRWLKSKCLMFLDYLIRFSCMDSSKLRSRMPLPQDWSKVIKDQMLERFTLQISHGGRIRRSCPARLKDKVVSYILVLSLMIGEYSIELTELLTDLQLSVDRLQNHFRALGCQVRQKKLTEGKKSTVLRIATLKLPLIFPDIRPNKKSKR